MDFCGSPLCLVLQEDFGPRLVVGCVSWGHSVRASPVPHRVRSLNSGFSVPTAPGRKVNIQAFPGFHLHLIG